MAQQPTEVFRCFGGLTLAEGADRRDLADLRSPEISTAAFRDEPAVEVFRCFGGLRLVECDEPREESCCSETTDAVLRNKEIARLVAARDQARNITAATAALTKSVEDYVRKHNISLADLGTPTKWALQHMINVARYVAKRGADDTTVSRGIVEECYRQALEVDEIPSREQFNCQYPTGKTAPFQKQKSASDSSSIHPAKWAEFWLQLLAKCPHGSTLFNPRTSNLVGGGLAHFTHVPRYLFRAFDESSSGLSNEHVVASQQSISSSAVDRERSKIDLLSRPQDEAARTLYAHLNKDCFGAGSSDDNLMSWSSSLPHVIQYAIWGLGHHNKASSQTPSRQRPPRKVRICALDTTKFPIGQFSRDTDLVCLCRRGAVNGQRIQQFFDFRINSGEHDNGDFLSQGEVYHAGRSCVFTLDELAEAGLYELYPELAYPTGQWTNRVLSLRSQWSTSNYPTSGHDIQVALRLARTCFGAFDATDMASLLLAFKKRYVRRDVTTARAPQPLTSNAREERQKYLGHCGPEEVQRYMEVADIIQPKLDRMIA